MRARFTATFERKYQKLPGFLQGKVDKALGYLVADLLHPALRSKKYDEALEVWQARIDDHWRFYFQIHEGTIILLDIKAHKD